MAEFTSCSSTKPVARLDTEAIAGVSTNAGWSRHGAAWRCRAGTDRQWRIGQAAAAERGCRLGCRNLKSATASDGAASEAADKKTATAPNFTVLDWSQNSRGCDEDSSPWFGVR